MDAFAEIAVHCETADKHGTVNTQRVFECLRRIRYNYRCRYIGTSIFQETRSVKLSVHVLYVCQRWCEGDSC
jgi:hypothetical protein